MPVHEPIRLDAVLGSDLSVVNAARASFAKRSTRLTDRDRHLIRFLAEHGHTSPFRHAAARFHVTSTLRERVLWETGVSNPAGMVFKPALAELVGAGHGLDDRVAWRWTASLQAAARFVREFGDHPALGAYAERVVRLLARRFPESTAHLTGYRADDAAQPAEEGPAPDWGHVPVLDAGYVRYVQHLDGPTDEECLITLEVKAPLMVRSQWFKYVRQSTHTPPVCAGHALEEAGSGNGDDCDWGDPLYARNEMSRRYVTAEPEFYVPGDGAWRSAPESRKQGSGEPLPPEVGGRMASALRRAIAEGLSRYREALELGVAAEQARAFLPAYVLYTHWYWTASLRAVTFFLAQRLEDDAQWEIHQYARAVRDIVGEVFGLRARPRAVGW